MILLLSLFYYYIDHTVYIKSCFTLFLSICSLIVCYINRNLLCSRIDQQGYLTLELNTFFKAYLFVDLINHILKNRNSLNSIRKDLILHHIVILIPYTVRPYPIGLTFCIIAEMYSTGAFFNLSPRNNLIYRAFIIILIRMSLWIFLISNSFLKQQDQMCIYFERYISSTILLLDLYWFRLILKKIL